MFQTYGILNPFNESCILTFLDIAHNALTHRHLIGYLFLYSNYAQILKKASYFRRKFLLDLILGYAEIKILASCLFQTQIFEAMTYSLHTIWN